VAAVAAGSLAMYCLLFLTQLVASSQHNNTHSTTMVDLVLQMASQNHAGRVAELAPLLLKRLQFSAVEELPSGRVLFSDIRLPPHVALAHLAAAAPAIMARVHGLFWLPHERRPLALAQLLESPPPPPTFSGARAFRVIATDKLVEQQLAAALERTLDIPYSRREFSHCLFAVGDPSSVDCCWMPRDTVYLPSPDSAPLHGTSVATAVRKLDEALSVVSALHSSDSASLRLGRAIDVGAAPGAWTARLAERCSVVVAVDPANLAPAVAALPNVRHVQRLARDAVDDVRRLLGGELADILCCDANEHPADAVQWIVPLLPLLKPGCGVLVMTLKFRGTGRNRATSLAHLDAELAGAMQTPGRAVWLMSNTGHERTYIAWRKPAAVAHSSIAESGSPFGALDDFSLGHIFEFVGLAAPVTEWGTLCRVCRRWQAVATPVLRRMLRSLWPCFEQPLDPHTSRVVVESNCFTATLRKGSRHDYAWAFVRPLPDSAIGTKGVGVRFVLSRSGGVYLGLFAGPKSLLPPVPELCFTPHGAYSPPGLSSCVLGCYSGGVFSRYRGRVTGSTGFSLIQTPPFSAYDVVINPDYKVSFYVQGGLYCTVPFFTSTGQCFEDDDVLCFAIGFSDSGTTAQVIRLP